MLLKSKLHRVTVTETDLHYEGSCAVDELLLEAAELREYEQVDIYNVNTGQRFTTYVVRAPRGSGTVRVMGAAARLASPGDHLIVAAYALFEEAEAAGLVPRIVQVDAQNHLASPAPVGAGQRARPASPATP
jgi:aspartate 1-decarboxylase